MYWKRWDNPARLKDIVDGALSLIQTVFKRDQISLEIDVPEDLPKIKCRSQQIQQVIMNLITNARDSLNEKYPDHDENKKIIVSSNLFKKERKDWIRITVKDHHGELSVESEPGRYTKFHMDLPVDNGWDLEKDAKG